MHEEDFEVRDEDSLRERARGSMKRRQKQVRTRIILLNAAVALLVIMIVFAVKVASLNKSDQVKHSGGKKVEQASVIKKDEKKETATPKPTATPEPTGPDRWLRKDLDRSKPMVALTFDDGPYEPVTKEILKTAKKYDARVTFFVVGNRIGNYSKIFKRAYDQGCQLASHTYEHKVLTGLSPNQIKAQVKKANEAMEKVIGCGATALRPPGGGVNDSVRKYVGLPMICWDVDTEDWKSRDAKKVLSRCKEIEDCNIVLMHDLYPSTAEAVKKLIPRLTKAGFQLVTVDELFYYKGIKLEKGKVYFNAK